MKVDDAVENITRFFNDLIGVLVPGSVFAFGVIVIHFGLNYMYSLANLGERTSVSLICAGLLFALGHMLLAVYDNLMKPFFQLVKLSKRFDEAEAQRRQSYLWFADLVKVQQGTSALKWGFHDLRSVALSVSPEAASIGRRFMFISLLCSGVGTALIILGLDCMVCLYFQSAPLYKSVLTPHWFISVVLLFSVALLLIKQSNAFYARAMTTPFSIAAAELMFKKENNAEAS
ncbi:hypothetical protein ACL2XQ_09590 [Sodalis sp. RH14]|uniref:hypothetical protein n=1 Tax=Sodalis sp. RH14 TaxID=3394329 RepID=UPI0039B6D5D9